MKALSCQLLALSGLTPSTVIHVIFLRAKSYELTAWTGDGNV
jgi:hypothetical protein